MAIDKGYSCKPTVLASGRPQPGPDGTPVPNWSHAFWAVLLKHGWLGSQRCETHEDIDFGPHAGGPVFIGPGRIPLTQGDLTRLASSGRPVFVEVGALAPRALSAAGVASSGHEHTFAEHRSVRVSAELNQGVSAELINVFGANGAFPFPSGGIRVRYNLPDPRIFAPTRADGLDALIRKTALRLLFATVRRTEQLIAEQNNLAFLHLLILFFGSWRLEPGPHQDRVRQTADRLLAALGSWAREQDAQQKLLGQLSVRGLQADQQKLFQQVGRFLENSPQIKTTQNRKDALADIVNGLLAALQGQPQALRRCLDRLFSEAYDFDKCCLIGGAGPDGKPRYLSHPVVAIALLLDGQDWHEPGLTDEAAAVASQIRADTADAWLQPPEALWATPKDGEDVLLMVTEQDRTIGALWRRGNIVFLGCPLMHILGYCHTLPPLNTALLDADYHLFFVLEHLLFTLVDQMAEASPLLSWRAHPWPWHPDEGGALVIRHDMDRPPSEEQFQNLLRYYDQRGANASWYWIADRQDASRIRTLLDKNHEIGLHANSVSHRASEARRLFETTGKEIEGENFHGAGQYHRGALSVLAGKGLGGCEPLHMLYSENSPLVYGLPYTRFPVLDEGLNVIFEKIPVNITFTYSTDGIAGQTRKWAATGSPAFSIACLKAGYYACVLNHPDMHFEDLALFLDEADDIPHRTITAAQLANWFEAIAQTGEIPFPAPDDAGAETAPRQHDERPCFWVKLMGRNSTSTTALPLGQQPLQAF